MFTKATKAPAPSPLGGAREDITGREAATVSPAPPSSHAPRSFWPSAAPRFRVPMIEQVTAHMRERAINPFAHLAGRGGSSFGIEPHEEVPGSPMEAREPAQEATMIPLQRACAGGCQCAKCSGNEEHGGQESDLEARLSQAGIQRAAAPDGEPTRVDPGAVQSRLTGGATLSAPIADRFSSAYGRDLSGVRVHTESTLARDLGARAFTVGQDVAFAPGEYRPGTPAGDRLIGHELAHVVQQAGGVGAVQGAGLGEDHYEREADRAAEAAVSGGAAAGLSPLAAGVQRAPAKDAPEANPEPHTDAAAPNADDVIAREDQAFLAVQGRSGKPAVDLTLSFPRMTPIESERLTIVGFASRTGAGTRRAFDSAGAATAFASLVAAGSGAVVIEQDRFFFVALVSASSRFRREQVWKVEPFLGVHAAIGVDGSSFPLDVELQPDPAKARFYDPAQAGPVAAGDLRRIMGVRTVEENQQTDKAGKAADEKVPLTRDQEEALILSYFRARAMEVLAENAAMVDKLAEDFSPTSKGDANTPSEGVSSSAKTLIDSSRRLGGTYRELLEKEAALDKYLSLVEQERSFSGANWRITVGDRSDLIGTWIEELKAKKRKVEDGKQAILSRTPMLAQMVGVERKAPSHLGTFDRFSYWLGGNLVGFGEHVKTLWSDKIESPTVYGENQLDASSFGKGASDEALRQEFGGKLDDLRKALRDTRSNIVDGGDGFALGMASLRQRVAADVAGNPPLKKRLDELLSDHAIIDAAVSIGVSVIQIGLLFVPGGQLISAAIGMAHQIGETDRHLKEWDASKAAIDPTRALVDQQEASSALLFDTVMLAIQAVDLASSLLGNAGKAAKGAEQLEEAAAGRKVVGEAEEVAGKTRLAPALEQPGAMKSFAEGALKTQIEKISQMSGGQRLRMLGGLVNERLTAAGVPTVKIELGSLSGAAAHFDHHRWTIVMDLSRLTEKTLDVIAFEKLLEHAYHEGRHAEQFFLIARRQAALGATAKEMTKRGSQGGLDLQRPIARAAAQKPLDLASAEAADAAKWHGSIFGAGRAARQATLREMDEAAAKVARWEGRIRKLSAKPGQANLDEIAKAKDQREAARAVYDEKFVIYKAFPEEEDAWAVGEQARKAYLDARLSAIVEDGPPTVRER